MSSRRKEGYDFAVQITRDTFDSPRDDHVPGVQYSPRHRCAFVPTDMGLTAAGIGDWIVRKADGKLEVFQEEDFEAVYGADELKQHPTARELLAEIERFLHRHDMNPTTFGIDCMNDGNYLPRLRRGRTPTLQTVDKVRNYLKRKTK